MAQFQVPQTFKAAQLNAYRQELQVVEIQTPELKQGEVLIKVEAAPVNPSDLLSQAGHYPTGQTLPAIIGLEGSGVIVQLHQSVQTLKVGTRVAFTTTTQFGSYGQYAVTPYQQVIPLDDDISFEIGASAIINPVTVLLMLEEAKERGAKAVVHTAAASALGRMFVKYFQNSGINVINVVRREEQIQLLTNEGAKYVLNSSTPTFFQDLNKLATELEATVVFDAIGGNQTGLLLQQLPNNSTIYVYGALSGQDISNVTISDLLFKGKTVKGFWLMTQLHKYNPFADPNASKRLNELLKSSLKTEYANQFSLDKINEGITYYRENQTSRKILIRPNQ